MSYYDFYLQVLEVVWITVTNLAGGLLKRLNVYTKFSVSMCWGAYTEPFPSTHAHEKYIYIYIYIYIYSWRQILGIKMKTKYCLWKSHKKAKVEHWGMNNHVVLSQLKLACWSLIAGRAESDFRNRYENSLWRGNYSTVLPTLIGSCLTLRFSANTTKTIINEFHTGKYIPNNFL